MLTQTCCFTSPVPLPSFLPTISNLLWQPEPLLCVIRSGFTCKPLVLYHSVFLTEGSDKLQKPRWWPGFLWCSSLAASPLCTTAMPTPADLSPDSGTSAKHNFTKVRTALKTIHEIKQNEEDCKGKSSIWNGYSLSSYNSKKTLEINTAQPAILLCWDLTF